MYRMTLFCLPLSYEGLPLNILEAKPLWELLYVLLIVIQDRVN